MNAILDALVGHARTRGTATALSGDGESLPYSALETCTRAASARLAAGCTGAGPVAVSVRNGVAWVILDLALQRIGATMIPLPTFFSPAQRSHVLKAAGASVLISDDLESDCLRADSFVVHGTTLFIHALENVPVKLPRGTAKITYTSGTTGAPKGVCLSQAGIEQVAQSLVSMIGSEYARIHCAVLPLAILLENVAGLYTTLLCGGCYHVPPPDELGLANPFAPNFARLVNALASGRVTSTIMVPELLRGTLSALVAQGTALPDMKLLAVGGAKVARSLLAQAEELGLPVYQGYGLSEAASVVTLNTPAENRPGTVGRPLPHVAISLAPDGEVLFRSPAFLGYVGGVSIPDIYATGDIGQLDADGYLTIGGRRSDVIITGYGRNISPEWVESELLAQPEIRQAMVFGEGMPALAALLVPASAQVDEKAIQRAVDATNHTLPDYAQVRVWRKASQFTVTGGQLNASGKLRRKIIATHHEAAMASCFEPAKRELSFFERLVFATHVERDYLLATPQIRDGLAGRISLHTYRHYLGEAYHHVKHTVPLLTLAGKRLPSSKQWLRDALDRYVDEERGHEAWILDDIAHAGGDAEAVRNGTPHLATEFMVSYAYDFVNRINPVGLFGMVFVLEGTSTKLATVGAQALMGALGLPESCFRYLTSHGALDVVHMAFFQQLMNRIADREDQDAIIHMAKAMYVLFADMFRAIPHEEAISDAA